MISQNREKEAIPIVGSKKITAEKCTVETCWWKWKGCNFEDDKSPENIFLSKNFAANKKVFMCASTIIIHFKLNINTDFNLISDPFGARSSVASYSSKVEALDEIFYKSWTSYSPRLINSQTLPCAECIEQYFKSASNSKEECGRRLFLTDFMSGKARRLLSSDLTVFALFSK